MRKIIRLFLLLSIPIVSDAQTHTIDSLKQLLKTEKKDTSRVKLLLNLSFAYVNSKPDTALLLGQQALSLAKKTDFTKGEASSLNVIAMVFMYTGNYPKALEVHLQSLKKSEDIQDKGGIATTTSNIANVYSAQGDYRKAINYMFRSLPLVKSFGRQTTIAAQLLNIGDAYEKFNMPDSAKYYTLQGYSLSVQIKNKDLTGVALNNLGNIYFKMGEYGTAMHNYKSGIPYLTEERDDGGLCETYLGMAKLFQKAGNADSCLYYAKHSLVIAQGVGFINYVMDASNFLTGYYISIHNVDSAFVYQSAAIAARDSLFSQEKQQQIQSMSFDESQRQQEILDAKEAAQTQLKFNVLFGGLFTLLVIAFFLYRSNRQKRKANGLLQKQKEEIDGKAHELSVEKENLQQSYNNVEQLGKIGRKITSSLSMEKIIGTVYDNVNSLMDASVFGIGIYNDALKRIEFPATYEEGQALPFYANSIEDQNSFAAKCFKEDKEIIMGNLDKDFKSYIQQVVTVSQGKQTVSLIYLPLAVKEKILGVITIQSFKQNAYSDYHLFMLRNIAIYTAIALENAQSFEALKEINIRLKSTQTQLIQSEKMASLGELTAGIAHEIQNPLNFVNNFSEVSNELIDEMNIELEKGNMEEAKAIAGDIQQNLEKINHHGKRADAIVKGMLQHSRQTTGGKQPTDINTLCDEYLRLSYHGLRAKDKSFNATLKTDYDSSLQKVNIIPQDVGRVILNLLTNSFYAVNQKQKEYGGKSNSIEKSGDIYEPTVSVTTKRYDGHVEIKVSDNGNGIPQKVLDKIFQPFFTTKPTGEGTGLGLSISYDIITKGHGGQLKVITKYAEFPNIVKERLEVSTDKIIEQWKPAQETGTTFIITLLNN